MSETYEKQKNQVSMLEIVLMSVAGLISAPLLPFAILYMFLILKTDRKENFVLYPCIAFTAVMFGKLEQFFTQTIQITAVLVKGLINGKFAVSAYGNYSLSSWLILTSIAFAVASYAVKRIRYNRKKEQAGIVSMERRYREYGGVCCETVY